jgi:hypothetical protein
MGRWFIVNGFAAPRSSGASVPSTARISLQLSRLEHGEDPYAARLGAQVVRRSFEDGRVADAAITWDDALLNDLAACQRPRPDAEAQGRVGQRLRSMLDGAGLR